MHIQQLEVTKLGGIVRVCRDGHAMLHQLLAHVLHGVRSVFLLVTSSPTKVARRARQSCVHCSIQQLSRWNLREGCHTHCLEQLCCVLLRQLGHADGLALRALEDLL